MNGQIEVIGNPSSIIDYNLNKQFCDLKKIVITYDELIDSFEDIGAREIFDKLSKSSVENYSQNLKSALDSGILDSTINSELYKSITEQLSSISDTMMDIQLQGYNFMNSVSNSKFTLVLRTESFSISKYYEEKGGFLSSIRSLILDYLSFYGNTNRLNRLKNFHIEIYESLDIHKHVFLKKDGSKLILASGFGFPKSSPIDFCTGNEFYFSTGTGFEFFKNTQNSAVLREHNKLKESPIHTREKILSDDELVAINNVTKSISDAVIELAITSKGKLKILNLSSLDNSITIGNEHGFFINQSSKNYDKISLVQLRDDLERELPNPKYLLLKNNAEIQSFLSDSRVINYVDGIVLTDNIYIPLLDYLGDINDIDVIYYNHELSKSLNIELDKVNIKIGDDNQKQANAFNHIISEKTKPDEHLERLKQIDLSTPSQVSQQRTHEQQQVNQIAEGLISSPNSTMNSSNSYNSAGSSAYGAASHSEPGKKLSAIDMLMQAAESKQSSGQNPTHQGQPVQQTAMNTAGVAAASYGAAQTAQVASTPTPMPQSEPGKKLSAIDMLMHAAENKPANPPQQVVEQPQQTMQVQNQYEQPAQQQYQNQYEEQVQPQNIQATQNQYQPQSNPVEQVGKADPFAIYDEPVQPEQPEQTMQVQNQYEQPTQTYNEPISNEQEIKNEYLNREMIEEVADEILVEDFQSQNPQTTQDEIPQELQDDLTEIESEYDKSEESYSENITNTTLQTPQVDVERYDNIIATQIITLPNVSSQSYFVDSSNLGEITSQADLFFLTPTDENLSNSNLNYVIPLGVSENYSDNHNYILNSTNDYFLLNNEKLNLFINLSYIDDSIKENFIEKCLNHTKKAYIVLLKQDIGLIENYINKIDGVFIKDLESDEELELIEKQILGFEKKYLLQNF